MKVTTKILLAGVVLAMLGGGSGSEPVLAIGVTLFLAGLVGAIANGRRL